MRAGLLVLAAVAATLVPAGSAGAAEFRGTLEIRHSDDFKRDRTRTSYRLLRRGRSLPLRPTSVPSNRLRSGSAVVVRGRRVGSGLRGSLRPARIGVRAAAVTPGPRKTAVILVKFGPTEPFTAAQARGRVFTDSNSVNAYYEEDSYGDVSLVGKSGDPSGDVFGWYTIPGPGTDPDYGCNVDAIADDAQTAAVADGFDPAGYHHIAYVFPYQSACGGWSGLGELPGNESWMNGSIGVSVVAHELGHNMGLHHASSVACTTGGTPVTVGTSCSVTEYGDPFDVMGNGSRRNNAWHLRRIGFLPEANVETVSADGTYTLVATGTRAAAGTTQLLRVPRTGSATRPYYDLELRSAGGVFDNFSSASPAVQGVSIRTNPASVSPNTQSQLLDANPASSSLGDAPLAPGSTFSDGNVSITVESVTAGVATVQVMTGTPGPDTTPPSAPDPLGAQVASGGVTLGWPAASDNVGVAGYRVYRDNVLVADVGTRSWLDSAVTGGGTFVYRVAAYDAAGNSSLSAPLSVTVPSPAPPSDTPPPSGTPVTPGDPDGPGTDPGVIPDPPGPDITAPVVRIASPRRGKRLRRRAVVRASATDNAEVVKLEVFIDGRRRRVVRRPTVNWRWSLRRVRRGRHTVAVRAFDSSGNASVGTVRVRVRA
jgi:hypothetical protein